MVIYIGNAPPINPMSIKNDSGTLHALLRAADLSAMVKTTDIRDITE